MQERMTSKDYLEKYAKKPTIKRAKSKRWTDGDLNKSKEKNESKYRNKKTLRHGILFDSVKEANRYDALLILEKCKLISNIRRQVRFKLFKNDLTVFVDGSVKKASVYVADFVYTDLKTNKDVIEDVKSNMTAQLPLYLLKKQLMKENLGLDIIEV